MDDKTNKIVGWIMIIYMIITIVASFKIIFIKEYNKYDVNHDGVVNSLDLLELKQYLLNN